MNILNYILLVSGGLFVISMLLICLGLFLNPKPKNTVDDEYIIPPNSTNRHIEDLDTGDIDDMEVDEESDELDENSSEEFNEEDDEYSVESEQNQEDEADEEADPDTDTDEEPVTAVEDTEADKTAKNKNVGIDVVVTVIDNNKSYKVTVADEILIGRNPQCDVVVSKPMVSSVHCVLIRDGNKVMVEDNNSTNGTLLNGKQLKHVIEVKNNDVLTLGDRLIRINLD